tara:strand:- start:437 stop:898 length:462 start_codon:yes stop_codon:yes gene_type:complete
MAYPIYSDQDLGYLRTLEAERYKLSGQSVSYYTLNRGSSVDPLYGEAKPEAYQTHTLTMAITYQESDNKEPSVQDEGLVFEYDAEAFLAHSEWASSGPAGRLPKVGDVVLIMAEYFDVVKASKGGNVMDTVSAVGFKLMLRKRSKFDPQRRLT